MNIALVDMDQTLCDYEGAIEKRVAKALGGYINTPHGGWYNEEYKGIVELIKTNPGFWRTLPKIELGFKIVELLKEQGFQLHILTKGPYKSTSAWTEKVEWCREHLPGVPVTITEDKGLMYGKLLVDDWPIYCEAWLKFRPRGLVIMPAYHYNEGFDKLHPGQVIRATKDNLDEVKKLIEKVSKRQAGEPIQR